MVTPTWKDVPTSGDRSLHSQEVGTGYRHQGGRTEILHLKSKLSKNEAEKPK